MSNGVNVEERTAAELQRSMQLNELTSAELVEEYLRRIDSIDRSGPTLRAVIETNPDVHDIALARDEERRLGSVRGPLHGIPVLIKDNIDTKDAMLTTAGSLALAGAECAEDAWVVARLREAGAVILGKTNMSEWANFRSTHSSSGWSARGGQALNPYVLNRSPSGSSSGSATAVSANLCAVSLGSETDGSIVSPGSMNCVVGIKPTVGLVSRSGVIPISHTQDSVGPFGRTVADAALLLAAIAGVDNRDQATERSADHVELDYGRCLVPDGLRNARIGVAREHYFGYSDRSDAIAEAAIQTMRELGAVIIDFANIPTANEMRINGLEMEVLLHEFKHGVNLYLRGLVQSPVRSLDELIAFNEQHRDSELPHFGQELLLMAQERGGLDDPKYRDALNTNHRLSREEGIDAVMDEYALDALVAPTGSPAWLIDHVNGDHFLGASAQPAAVAGYPAVTVPAGFSAELPVGITFFGRAWSEPNLIKYAFAFEQATHVRRPPRYLAGA